MAICGAYSDYLKACEVLEREDMIIETGRNNYKQQHPMVTIRNTALDQIRLSDRYGLTPVSAASYKRRPPPPARKRLTTSWTN